MFQQTTFIILTSPSDGSFQSPRVGAGCHCLALQACHQVTSAQFQGVEASGQGRAADARGEDQIIQCEQGAVEVSHGDCGAFSRLNRRSEFRGFVGRNHARHPVMLRFSFLCFLLEQSYSNKMLSNGALHVMTIERTNENINKAESARMTDAVIKSAKALRRLYSMRLVGTPLAHETQGDGRAGGHRQAAARSRPRHRLGQRRRDRRRNPHRVLRRSGDRIT